MADRALRGDPERQPKPSSRLVPVLWHRCPGSSARRSPVGSRSSSDLFPLQLAGQGDQFAPVAGRGMAKYSTGLAKRAFSWPDISRRRQHHHEADCTRTRPIGFRAQRNHVSSQEESRFLVLMAAVSTCLPLRLSSRYYFLFRRCKLPNAHLASAPFKNPAYME